MTAGRGGSAAGSKPMLRMTRTARPAVAETREPTPGQHTTRTRQPRPSSPSSAAVPKACHWPRPGDRTPPDPGGRRALAPAGPVTDPGQADWPSALACMHEGGGLRA
eukprot:1795830-Rhodomonas_salina.2